LRIARRLPEKMSGGQQILQPDEGDISKLLAAQSHIGSQNVNYQMQQYIHKRRPDGVQIIDIKKMWEKINFAARAIVAIENPADVYVISSRTMGQRAVLKFAHYTGATPIAGRFTPGAFTNQIQAAFREPRLLVVTDPGQDHQPINEASYVNLPVIAFANTESCLRYVDVAIPCNNKGANSIGLMWWLLCREVLRLRGTVPRSASWEETVMPDLFFYRDPEEEDKKKAIKAEEAAKVEVAVEIPEETLATGLADTPAGLLDPTQPLTAAPKEEIVEDLTAQTGTTENWGAASSEQWA